ncbi:MAG TPA: ATP-binding protein, partial [Candidatus Saccharimonadales bacterium]|nr:ATP-binding protein [Candidatus Saccharimonadales bacterium]
GMGVAIAGVEIISRAVHPVAAPEAILLTCVAWAAIVCGRKAGYLSAAAVAGYSLYHRAAPGHLIATSATALGSVGVFAFSATAIALLARFQIRRTTRESEEEASRRAARRVEDLVHTVDAVLWEADPDSRRFVFISREAERLLGYPVSRWTETADFRLEILHPEDRDRVSSEFMAAVREGRDRDLEYRLIAADGRIVWVRDTVRTASSDGSRCLRGVLTDVSRAKREESLQAAQRRVLEMIAGGVSLERILGEIAAAVEEQVAGSRCAVSMLDPLDGRSRVIAAASIPAAMHEGVVALVDPVAHPGGRETAVRAVQSSGAEPAEPGEMLASLGCPVAWLQPILASGGERIGTLFVLGPEADWPSGEPARVLESAAGLAGIAMEKERSEEETRQSLSLLKATLESTTDGILVVDRQGKIVSHNRRFLEMWCIPREIADSRDDDQALAFVLDQLVDPRGFLDKVRELYSRPAAESFDLIEFRDGRIFERFSRPQRIDDECVGRVWSFRDVSDRHRAEKALRESEEQLRHSQKMEAVGRLAGGVAHDFNNLLTAITGYSDMVLRALADNDPICDRIREIRRASESAAGLTRQLLAFSRKQVLQLQILDLNEVISEINSLLRRTIGEDVELVLAVDDEIGKVRGDRGQIEQVLLNLAVNARDAMPAGGKLVIETSSVYLDEPYARRQTGVTPGHYALICVTDTGQGMDEETRGRIFEPFFTTKEIGRGTGLGLATVYGIVKQSGGNIWVYSEPGRGTTFKIYLPMVEETSRGRLEAPATADMPEGSGTILLVEDDDSVRGLVAVILAECGYSVVEACNGSEGLRLFETSATPIDLVVTDVVMPVMSGRDMAQRILAGKSDARILFISGYTETAVQHHGLLESGSNFLQKPFSPKALARKVQEILAAA